MAVTLEPNLTCEKGGQWQPKPGDASEGGGRNGSGGSSGMEEGGRGSSGSMLRGGTGLGCADLAVPSDDDDDDL
eukprot:5252277-Pyramimonas_sp.AAC.1